MLYLPSLQPHKADKRNFACTQDSAKVSAFSGRRTASGRAKQAWRIFSPGAHGQAFRAAPQHTLQSGCRQKRPYRTRCMPGHKKTAACAAVFIKAMLEQRRKTAPFEKGAVRVLHKAADVANKPQQLVGKSGFVVVPDEHFDHAAIHDGSTQ